MKGRTISQTVTGSLNYILDKTKTRNGELVSTYACDQRTAVPEFIFSRQEYHRITGREQRKSDVLMYHMRQSFKPGEITPEQALKIGHDLAARWTKGKHQFVVVVHEDKAHIHCHIMFNSVNIDCDRKFVNFWLSSMALRRLSDIICIENGLSIIESPKPTKGKNYGKWLGDKKEPSARFQLEQLIDKVLAEKPVDFESFIKLLEAENCEFKRSRRSVRLAGKKGFIRLNRLSDDYTETAIRERISGIRPALLKNETVVPKPNEYRFSLLIDVQNSIKAQNSPGYEQWAKIFSLKQAAKTLLYLQDNNLDDLEKLSKAAQQAKDDFNETQNQIQTADARLKEISFLQKHIGTYIKTKDIYAEYKRRKFSRKFLAENEKAINGCKAAKAYFTEQNLKKLPTMQMLKQEYAALVAEKKKLYSGYNAAKSHMQEILIAEQNVNMLLNYNEAKPNKENIRKGR
jgi:hypothetical protein